MKIADHFDVLFLIARPAAGKSEVIDYLKRVPPDERLHRFHIGKLVEIDDFPILWSWFEEDHLLERMGKPRLYTTQDGTFKEDYLWDLLIRRIDLEYHKKLRDADQADATALVEFSRGKAHGGYRNAFQHFSPDILRGGAILYINVSYKESLRKNRQRYNPNRPDSILEHGLSDEKMEQLYKEVDWDEFTAACSTTVSVKGINVPYAVFENEDDVTTARGEALGERLEETLNRLWRRYTARH